MHLKIVLFLILNIALNVSCSVCQTKTEVLNSSVNIGLCRHLEIKHKNLIQDSTYKEAKLSIAPIVAFGFVGFLVGGTVAALFDRSPDNVDEGDEFSLTVNKTALIGAGAGTIAGAYLGYRLAKRDLERKKEKQTQQEVQREK